MLNLDHFKARPFSASAGKAFRKSPKHMVKYYTDPRKSTDAFLLGSLAEDMLLIPEKFEEKYITFDSEKRPEPLKSFSSTKNKAWKADMYSKSGDKTIVDVEILKKAKMMAESAMSIDEIRKYVEAKVNRNIRLNWTDKKTGIPCIGYSDFQSRLFDENFVFEVKTSKDGDPDNGFLREAIKFDYPFQIGMYAEGYHKMKFMFPNFVFLVMENVEPFNASLIYCDNKFVNDARAEVRGTLNALKMCIDNDSWGSGYEFRLMSRDYFSMNLPPYYRSIFKGYE